MTKRPKAQGERTVKGNCFLILKEKITKVNIALKNKRGCGEVNMTELEIAVAAMHRLCKKAGAERVSEAAAKELAKALEEIGVKIAKEALDFSIHAGRKTVKAEDIEIAARKVMGK
jgi:DNA-binding protein